MTLIEGLLREGSQLVDECAQGPLYTQYAVMRDIISPSRPLPSDFLRSRRRGCVMDPHNNCETFLVVVVVVVVSAHSLLLSIGEKPFSAARRSPVRG